MAAVDYITIKGFKSIASIERLALRPINIVIGPNGSGKSNFLEVFELLQASIGRRLPAHVNASGGASRLLHYGPKTTQRIELRLSAGLQHYQVALRPTRDDQLFAEVEGVENDSPLAKDARLRPFASNGGAEPGSLDLDPMASLVSGWSEGWRVYHLHDTTWHSPMRRACKLDDNRLLRTDGGNLAAFLYLLYQHHREQYELIRRTIQSVAPFLDDFQLQPRGLEPDQIKLEWRHKDSDQYFDATSLSDGTLRFIALATLFLQPIELRPSIILVDEPELGLHPSAIQILASMIRHASVDTQVIVSTQSSLLIDHFEPEDVLVADRVNGATQIQRLAPEPLAAWLEDYSLGQLWEKNEIGGRPHPD